MPCNCDYMEPTEREIELSRIACLVDELDGKQIDKTWWKGYHPNVYSQTYDRYSELVESYSEEVLAERLRLVDISKHSLEMQIWWRDYQERNLKAQREADKVAYHKTLVESALSKLTNEEKMALGLDNRGVLV